MKNYTLSTIIIIIIIIIVIIIIIIILIITIILLSKYYISHIKLKNSKRTHSNIIRPKINPPKRKYLHKGGNLILHKE